MSALEWFEETAALARRVEGLKADIESAYVATQPHGQLMGSIGANGRRDAMAPIDRIIDSDAKIELDRCEARLRHRLEYGTRGLYGSSGRGGLARARGYDDADILCCHYLQGMGWADIAREIVRYDTDKPSHWCQMRARRACEYIDRIGMDSLASS